MTPEPITESSAIYQISVSGFLDASWSTRLGGMSFDHQSISDNTITTLTGEIIDQSQLNGVLNALFNHRLEVLSVLKIK
ncbi:MAG: hypothetical protein JXR07_18010 [Reichenbachiella sp.]